MLTLTRTETIAYARYVYKRLAMRAFDAADRDRDYIRLLAKSWDDRLGELGRSGPTSIVPEEIWFVLDHLAATVGNPDLTSDALVEWVDAFPDAVADLLPVAAVRIEPESDAGDAGEPVAAGNRQSTLALAA